MYLDLWLLKGENGRTSSSYIRPTGEEISRVGTNDVEVLHSSLRVRPYNTECPLYLDILYWMQHDTEVEDVWSKETWHRRRVV